MASSLAFAWSLGSSPLTRGKHCLAFLCVSAFGLIPAHAGKTGSDAPCVLSPGAHPRSRGENQFIHRGAVRYLGSSPLMRGKQLVHFLSGHLLGLIPAHAGKTIVCPSVRVTSRAHPRSREENHAGGGSLAVADGSSPLTRGKREDAHGGDVAVRLIPAHAGKTQSSSSRELGSRAHPRSRGENEKDTVSDPVPTGSSPLTRGKLVDVLVGQTRSGLIPAHAGKTVSVAEVIRPMGAHPRSRGENRR